MPRTQRDLVIIGASAGGFGVIRDLLKGLPSPLQPAVIVISHLPPGNESQLAPVLQMATGLDVRWAEDGAPLTPGTVIVAPGGRHLLLSEERVRLVGGARENHARPSISRTFRSAAACCGGRTVGVLLSGALDDGVSGLATLRRCGGLIAVQHPEDAFMADLPRNALAALSPDAVLRAAEAGDVVAALLRRPVTEVVVPASISAEAKLDLGEIARPGQMAELGPHSVVTCPDCGGPTWTVGSPEHPAYRCLVGHRLAAPLALREKDVEIERAMWTVVRGLEERLAIRRRLQLEGEGLPEQRHQHEHEERLLARARDLADALIRSPR